LKAEQASRIESLRETHEADKVKISEEFGSRETKLKNELEELETKLREVRGQYETETH
jgi:uncharacterized protein YlxW (UPF0749 family)